jgi:hypothetical protein
MFPSGNAYYHTRPGHDAGRAAWTSPAKRDFMAVLPGATAIEPKYGENVKIV